jgi:putative hemolysin
MSAAIAAKRMIQTFKEAARKKSLLQQVRDYRGFVKVEYESPDFAVTTATNGHQLIKVLELRHEVFVEEWQGRRAFHRMDVDEYDFMADHLLITDKKSNEVVGTYRLLSSHFTRDFYTSSEFHLGDFVRTPTVKLEMGRACIQESFRNGSTIDVLWKGLTQYIKATKTEILFGCSSVKAVQPGPISSLYRTLIDQGSWSEEFGANPLPSYHLPGLNVESAPALTAPQKRELLPPLLRSYLHAGAKVHGLPAWDRAFGCIDLLTILDWSQLNQRFQSRFTN